VLYCSSSCLLLAPFRSLFISLCSIFTSAFLSPWAVATQLFFVIGVLTKRIPLIRVYLSGLLLCL
jgi:hypothetical protein